MRYLILPSMKYVNALRAATRTALRMGAWNVLFIISGLLLIALVGEAYFRLTRPFTGVNIPTQFVDGVGIIYEPNAELRYANWRDGQYVISRANSQGFLDREPISPEHAAEGCHITFIGDSFVEAREAHIADKFQVRLEEMAARELPHLDIATQAYGIRNTGQINQIPFYDNYARHLNPKLVVLVFFLNDFQDNSVALYSLSWGLDPDRMPYMFAQRDASGVMKLRPPDPEYRRFMLPRPPKPPNTWSENAQYRLIEASRFAKWLNEKNIWQAQLGSVSKPDRAAWAATIAEHPCCASLADWRPSEKNPFTDTHPLAPVYEEALEYTAFGIEQFKRRADRDGVNLAILSATAGMGTRGAPQFERMRAIAEAHGIPIISDWTYNISQRRGAWDGHLDFDGHWNATGHQWVAEALLEWLKANQDVCD